MDTKKLCIVLNLAPHYRKAIYQAIDNEFDCDWYVGDHVDDIKTMLPSDFRRCKVLKNRFLYKKNYFQVGICRLLFTKKYTKFLVTGDIRNISLWLFLLMSKIFPTKKVYLWTHGDNGQGGALKNILKNIFARLSSGIFLYGNFARDYMVANGINPNKLFVIHNSLDYQNQIKYRTDQGIENVYVQHFRNNNPNVVFIGRLTFSKRLDMLITAVSILKQRGVSLNVTLVGGGEEKKQLVDLVTKLSLDSNVWFYGPSYDEQHNATLLCCADICVSPGEVGLTAIHSMTYGTPVITHDNYQKQGPEFESIIVGKTGDFFEYNNLISLVDTMEKWLCDHKDDREDVRQYCMQEIDENWTPQYQIEVLKQHL